MKQVLLTITLLLAAFMLQGQTKAVTEHGDVVVLYDDGSYTYVDDSIRLSNEIAINEKNFKTPRKSKGKAESRLNDSYVLYNKDMWTCTELEDESYPKEYQFTSKDQKFVGLLLTEDGQTSIVQLAKNALQNVRELNPDITVEEKEFRNVNGTKVLMLRFRVKIKGMPLCYQAYYYSGPEGSTQFLVFGMEEDMELQRDDIEDFLNGYNLK